MAENINNELKTELENALAVLEPQIRGLHDLTQVSISGELNSEIATQIEIRERRQILIQNVLNSLATTGDLLSNLRADGYPEIQDSELPPNLFGELSEQDSDIDSAIAIFKRESAKTISVNLGNPANKPEEEKS